MVRRLYLCIYFIVQVTSHDHQTDRLTERRTEDDFLNTCLLGKNHKAEPGPEGTLHKQCTPWKYRSCCLGNVTQQLQEQPTWYKFNFDHCNAKKPMSDACKKHFFRDLCFYECSPNVGPWLVQDTRTWRSERFVNVPLCSSECTNWWNDCKGEYTCSDNWSAGNFNFSSGSSACHDSRPCKPYSEVYKTAENFCQTVWDHSWKVVDDQQPCFKIWFDPDNELDKNPNDKFARMRARELLGISSGNITASGMMMRLLNLPILCLLWYLFMKQTA